MVIMALVKNFQLMAVVASIEEVPKMLKCLGQGIVVVMQDQGWHLIAHCRHSRHSRFNLVVLIRSCHMSRRAYRAGEWIMVECRQSMIAYLLKEKKFGCTYEACSHGLRLKILNMNMVGKFWYVNDVVKDIHLIVQNFQLLANVLLLLIFNFPTSFLYQPQIFKLVFHFICSNWFNLNWIDF